MSGATKILKDARLSTSGNMSLDLAIELSPRRIACAANDLSTNKLMCFMEQQLDEGLSHEEYARAVSGFLAHEFLKSPFVRTRVISCSTKSTLIPESLFSKNDLKRYFEFNHKAEEDTEYLSCKIKNGSIYCVFTLDTVIKEMIRGQFPSCSFYHQAAPFIDGILLSVKNKVARRKVFVNVDTTCFDVVVVNGENLLLHNTFSYQTETDFVFYLMSVFELLKLNPQVSELTFAGDITLDSPIVVMTKRFVKNINFVSFKDEKERMSYVFDELPLHKYVNLLNIFKCE